MTIGQQPQSFRGYAGLAFESSYGDGGTPTTFLPVISDGFSQDNQTDYQNTTRSRAAHKGEAGALDDSGSVDLPAAPENGLGMLLLGALGAETVTSPDPDVGEHVFSPSDTLPSMAVEIGRDLDTVRHVGAGVDTLELSHTEEDRLSASADIQAKLPDGSVSAAAPTYSDLRTFRFQDISLTIGGEDRVDDIQDLTLTIENDLGANYRGNRTASKMEVGERTVSWSATLDFETRTLFRRFLGASDATEPQDSLASVSLSATWTTPETIGVSGTQYALTVDTPNLRINTHEATLNQNDAVVEDVEMRAVFDTSIGAEAEVTLTNGITSTYN